MELKTIVIEQESNGKQMMEITSVPNLGNLIIEDVNFDLDFELSSRITNVIGQLTPSLLTVGKTLNSNLMEVTINGELSKAADGIGYRAFARGDKGQITEHAKLFEPKDLKKMVAATAVWQTLSMVVAQSHLSEINDKLEEIKKTVFQISDFQKNERTTKVLSIRDEISNKIFSLKANKNKEKTILTMPTLDNWSTQLSQIYQHLLMDIEEILKKKETDYEKVKERTLNVERLIREATLSLYLRAICYELSTLIYQFTIDAQREKIKDDMDKMDELLVTLYQRMYIEIDGLSSWFKIFKSFIGIENKTLNENYENFIFSDLLDERKKSQQASSSNKVRSVSELEYQKYQLKKLISDAGIEYNNKLLSLQYRISKPIINALITESSMKASFQIDNSTNVVKCVNIK